MASVELNPKFYREGYKTHQREVRFLLSGGIGDMICYMTALDWIAQTQHHVKGEIYVPTQFYEIAKNLMDTRHPTWQVLKKDEFELSADTPCFSSMIGAPLNPTGAHMVDLGYVYYANMCPPPADANKNYLELELINLRFPEVLKDKLYVVMTPGFSTKAREMPAKTFNLIKEHFFDLGYEVVLLGREIIGEKREIKFNSDYNMSGCHNLLNATTLLEAANIIKYASLIVGLDNGLLHLAAMTSTPIVFGYNIAGPIMRQPRRPSGKIFNVAPDQEKLSCTHCQDKMRFLFNHTFDRCMFEDYQCLEDMHDKWIPKIDEALS